MHLSRGSNDERLALATCRTARNGALLLGALASAALAPFAPGAAASVAVGCAASVLGGRLMVKAMHAVLAQSPLPEVGRRRAIVGALLRYPLIGFLLYEGIHSFALPIEWLAVGVSAWPLALVAAVLADASRGERPAPSAPSPGA